MWAKVRPVDRKGLVTATARCLYRIQDISVLELVLFHMLSQDVCVLLVRMLIRLVSWEDILAFSFLSHLRVLLRGRKHGSRDAL